MSDVADGLVATIDAAFASPYPGDGLLQGSIDGCEPYEEVGPFTGRTDWRALDPGFLDAHAGALAFFSQAGLRFFLPAFLVADVREALQTADPAFALTHGFTEVHVLIASDGVDHRSGGAVPVNPRRYGALTWEEAARHRLAVFCREEAAAVAAYLRHRAARDTLGVDRPRIFAALDAFWDARAAQAPTRAELDDHRASFG